SMLNTFPTLLSFAIFIPFIFRIFLTLFIFELAIHIQDSQKISDYFKERKIPLANYMPKIIQVVLFILSIFILIGLYTQITSLVTFCALFILGNINKHAQIFRHSESAFTFAMLICFSLLFLGAGVFAFDL